MAERFRSSPSVPVYGHGIPRLRSGQVPKVEILCYFGCLDGARGYRRRGRRYNNFSSGLSLPYSLV